MNRSGLLRLDEDDVAFIMGKCFRYFTAIINGNYCNDCKSTHTSKLTDYDIFLDASNNILIYGRCDRCTSSIKRCIETGEKIGPNERAEITWTVKVELLGGSTT